ncbi:hypothetical protein HQ550_01880, partial [bacterium]|nr:hypothetical protein [bacterium]
MADFWVQFFFFFLEATSGKPRFWFGNNDRAATSALTASQWAHIAASYDDTPASDNFIHYLNGNTNGVSTGDGTENTSVTVLSIGTGSLGLYDGIIDEVRISSVARTAPWINATYNSLYDTLLTYGSEESYVHPVPADFAHRIKLTIDNTKIDSTLTHFPVTV